VTEFQLTFRRGVPYTPAAWSRAKIFGAGASALSRPRKELTCLRGLVASSVGDQRDGRDSCNHHDGQHARDNDSELPGSEDQGDRGLE